MPDNHMKRISAPRTWPLLRKSNKFVMRPDAGKRMDLSLPLGFILKEVLGLCQTTKQVKAALVAKSFLVNGKVIHEMRFPVGLFDVIEVPAEKKVFRLIIGTNGKLAIIAISHDESKTRLQKIVSKVLIKGNIIQIGLTNGEVVRLTPAQAKEYKVSDSVLVGADNKIQKHFPIKENMYALFIGGKHMGSMGTIKTIEAQKIMADVEGVTVETLKKYAFVVGQSKAEIQLK